MKMKPLVTVIMAAYNSEKYIKEAIESILNQTYVNLELIIVEDAATDRTLQIIQEFSDQRIRLLSNQENRGTLYSMRRAVREAYGEFIAVLDSDDVSYPDRIQKQVSFLQTHPEVLLCSAKADLILGGKTKKAPDPGIKTMEELRFSLLFSNYIVHSTVMFRKDELGKRNIRYRKFSYCHDYYLILEAAAAGQICLIDDTLGAYRIHSAQKTHVLSGQKRVGETKNARKRYVKKQNGFSKAEKNILYKAIEGEVKTYREFEILKRALKRYMTVCGLDTGNKIVKKECTEMFLQQKNTWQRLLAGMTCSLTDKKLLYKTP